MLITRETAPAYARRHAGGKGLNLYLLSRAGFSVPRWVVIGDEHFVRYRELAGLDSQLADRLGAGDAAGARALIETTPLPGPVEEEIRTAWCTLGAHLIAVRSSALGEDAAGRSFAGQLSSFLYVRSEEEALEAVKGVWASGYSDRAVSYRKQTGLGSHAVEVAVILQEMVNARKSGVMFTCDPVSGRGDRITINSVYGLGEGLVSGQLDADTAIVDKDSLEVVSLDVADKRTQLVRAASGRGVEEVAVPEALQREACLGDAEQKKIARIGLEVERFFRFPQDIEWAIDESGPVLLQARPVTTEVRTHEGYLHIWDNSNIVESYGGITLPLTFTFARFVYRSVYVQFCEVLNVPAAKIVDMDRYLSNMLGSFYGRVYYNILNWYKLTSILPGFRYNRVFMETMMGTPHRLADEIADRIKPPGFQEKLSSKIQRFLSGLKFLYFHFVIQRVIDSFLKYFHTVYEEVRRVDFERLSSDEIIEHWHGLATRLLHHWKAPIINDYLTMVHFGLFKKLTASWLGHVDASLQNDLLCGEGNMESAEPTRELIRMAAEAGETPGLRDFLVLTPAQDLIEALRQSEYTGFMERVERYIDKFGFRCMNEMKLEQQDLHQDPTFLFVCLKNYLRSGTADLDAYENREREIRRAAEKVVARELSGYRKRVYRWSLKNARKAVRNRENTRFCRTRIYGVVRAMFYSIGRDFTLRRIIDEPRDIFYITLDELFGSMRGHLVTHDLRALVALRKKEYAAYEQIEPAPRFYTRGPTYWMNDHFSGDSEAPGVAAAAEGGDAHHMHGMGCCPGIVEGVVKVIRSPDDDMELNGEILCTIRTDPGWIPLYPSASGLLVERGGLLSHSAIVAREMGLPTVVGLKGLTKRVRSGMRVRLDGQTGEVELLD
jgi:phosphohistidine swiveling domain-containing protein